MIAVPATPLEMLGCFEIAMPRPCTGISRITSNVSKSGQERIFKGYNFSSQISLLQGICDCFEVNNATNFRT